MLVTNSASAVNPSISASDTGDNPFLTASTLPYQLPPFDRIKDGHYLPAFAEGMRQQQAEVNTIADNAAAPSFDNTIVALERSGQVLTRVSKTFFNLTGANTNDTLESIQRELSPKLAAHGDSINLNGKLFERVKTLYEKRNSLSLDAESKRLLWRYHTDFVRAGAQLSDADRESSRP